MSGNNKRVHKGFNEHGATTAAMGITGTSPSTPSSATTAATTATVTAHTLSATNTNTLTTTNTTTVATALDWSIQDSMKLYSVSGWGAPYFSINPKGHLQIFPLGQSMESGLTAASPTVSPTALPTTTTTAPSTIVSAADSPPIPSTASIDLYDLVRAIKDRGTTLPVLIRFDDILQDRINRLNLAFAKAIKHHQYQNVYKGVFPVKVCQQHRVVQQIVEYGKMYQYGLEAGSKPELLIVLAMLRTPGALITCNGYKDSEYIEIALLGQLLGHQPIITIEKMYELDIVLQASKKLGISPLIGVRAKLASKGSGHWANSTGERAKFGLTPAEIDAVVKRLKQENQLKCLQLLHYHIGSQITKIETIKDGVREAAQFFTQLHAMGANMKYVDVGGGLGIDYDGSKTEFHASMNYTMDEYASVIVRMLKQICEDKKVPVPVIVTESGRAIASHMTVLVMNVLEATSLRLDKPNLDLIMDGNPMLTAISGSGAGNTTASEVKGMKTTVKFIEKWSPNVTYSKGTRVMFGDSCYEALETISIVNPTNRNPTNGVVYWTCVGTGGSECARGLEGICGSEGARPYVYGPQMSKLVEKMTDLYRQVCTRMPTDISQIQELYHECRSCKEESLQHFTLGILSLSDRALIEALYFEACHYIQKASTTLSYVPEELQELSRTMSWTYYCNFSVFQSAPDNWAIGQLFPFMPIHRLDEKPTRLAILADLTCDSDGKIDKFICSGTDDVKNFLEVHELRHQHDSGTIGSSNSLSQREDYYIGMFLNGAYQEVLGNLHNLYGDTNVVHVSWDQHKQQPTIEHVVKGDTTEEVLKWMQYDPKSLISSIRSQADAAVKNKLMVDRQYKVVVERFENALNNYTYLSQ